MRREYQPPPEVLRLIEEKRRGELPESPVSEMASAMTQGAIREKAPQAFGALLTQETGEIDDALMVEIVEALESAFLASGALWRGVSAFVEEHRDALERFGESMESMERVEDIDWQALLAPIARKWRIYATTEAAIAVRIYNKVRAIHDTEARRQVIEREVAFFTQVKNLMNDA
ncbi:MAG TPA: hypothetical protein VNL74_07035 [Methylococcus sp.]|nr:hypothetical protein [Methylococcus sp.]